MYDSSGVLSVMPRFRVPLAAMWTRILHTGQIQRVTGGRRSYWPVGVVGHQFFCLVLGAEQTYPGFPRPLIQDLPICVPFKQIDSPVALLEQQ